MPLPHELSEEVLGYVLHTNRELGLMLKGVKPLAVFSEVDGDFVEPLRRYIRMFDRHARASTFVRQDHIEDRAGRTIHVVLFARPDEVWRIARDDRTPSAYVGVDRRTRAGGGRLA
jgi:hypothetical protein